MIFQKKNEYIWHVFYKSLAYGAFILEIMVIADNNPTNLCCIRYK